jgi:hypothetical protein
MGNLKKGDVKVVGDTKYTCNGGTTKVEKRNHAIRHESTTRSNLRINQGR